MKLRFTTLIMLFCLATFAQKQDPSIKVLSTSDGVFHFKVKEKLQDAFVEVLDASNRVISKKPLDCKRMLIDFYDATPGTYHIHISAKNYDCTYDYTLVEEKGYMKITTAIVQPKNLSFEKYNTNKTK